MPPAETPPAENFCGRYSETENDFAATIMARAASESRGGSFLTASAIFSAPEARTSKIAAESGSLAILTDEISAAAGRDHNALERYFRKSAEAAAASSLLIP